MSIDPKTYRPGPRSHAGRVILVTGAGDGIGRAVAMALAAHGATVLLLGRTPRKLEATYDAITAAGGPQPALAPFNLETATAKEYDELAAVVEREFGRLDGLAHIAGILGARSPIDHHDVPAWVKTLHVNATAPFILTQTLLPLLRRSHDGTILFTSSTVGRRGRAYWGAYAVSKFALEGLMQVLAHELDGTTVRANSLNPGAVRTAMRTQAYPGEDPSTLPTPAEVVAPFLYLLGPDSRGVNGEAF
jgi:NAD(P)-dependent dehydrogenase (short-subunit alcohol dehydrogenase family)